MEKEIKYLQEEEIIKKAKQALREFVEKDYAQNPIKAQFKAFQKAKRQVKFDDLII